MGIRTAEAVEARIQNYTNDQLRGVREAVDVQALRLALGFGGKETIFAQLRVLSTVFRAGGGRGFMDEQATPEDLNTSVRVHRDLNRLDTLLSLSNKLTLEAGRREMRF